MSKIAINNEIVLMRQAVRKARVAVVRKLIKEAKLLQARKHGDEKTIEKCKRKGQRLVAEIAAAKKIKDDDITRFAVTNTRKLSEVLNDCTCEPATRLMSRLTFQKILADRIAKFKEKFPEYEEHLGPGRKKLSKIQRQANREARNAMKRNPGINTDGEKATNINEDGEKEEIDDNVSERSNESGDEEDEIAEDSKKATESSDSDGELDAENNFTESADTKITEAEEEDSSLGKKKLLKVQKRANGKMKNATKRNAKVTKTKGQGSEEEAQINETVNENTLEHSDESGNEEDRITETRKEATEFSNSDGEAESRINEADEEESEEIEGLKSKHGSEPGSILRIKTPSSVDKRKKREKAVDSVTKDLSVTSEEAKNNKSKKDKKMKPGTAVDEETTKQRDFGSKASAEPKKPKPIKVISREASVKRFAELADVNESEEIVREPETIGSSKRRDVKIEKEVDSFFMTENGESEYLSVVVPKSKLCEDDEQDERFGQNHAARRQANFHERNNKFFSKIDQRSSGGAYGDKHASNVAGRKRSINLPNRDGGPAKKFGREASGRNARADFEKKVETKEEVLHPSWAARKKQQEILKQGFQGKKIVFDD